MSNLFHDTAVISKLSSIDISLRGTNTYIGANSVIDDFVKIKHVGGDKDIIIGDNVYINSGTVLYSGNGIVIGNNVLIGPNCNLTPVNHNFFKRDQLIRLQGFLPSKGGITIEEDVWIGANVTILDGSVIRKGAVIGANSLVKNEVEAYSINVGTPLKKIKSR
jgi:virginiamycin A acetyltransferase